MKEDEVVNWINFKIILITLQVNKSGKYINHVKN